MKPIAPAATISLRRTRALWKVSSCEEYLGLCRSEIIHRIEDGRLPWAFCISSAKARRRELRVLSACVIEAAGQPTGLTKPTAALSFDEVIKLILRHSRPDLRGTELKRVFSVTHQMISELHRRRALKVSVRAQAADGPNSSHKFSRSSVVEFLRQTPVFLQKTNPRKYGRQ